MEKLLKRRVVSYGAVADVDLNILQEENRLLAGLDNVQEKAIQYKSAGKTSLSSVLPE